MTKPRFTRNRGGGRVVICTPANARAMCVRLNTYDTLGIVVGVCFYPPRFGNRHRRYLSWVWPWKYNVQSVARQWKMAEREMSGRKYGERL